MEEQTQCWVLNCASQQSEKQKLYPLPENLKNRDTWLALAGKPVTTSQIYFCGHHFKTKFDTEISRSLPTQQVPQKICQLCLTFIETTGELLNDSIYVLSNNIMTDMPKVIDSTLSYYTKYDPLPLSKMLSFCLSKLEIPCNPPPLLCKSCFTNLWLFYLFKVSAIDTEKKLLKSVPSLENYSKMFMCRACPTIEGSFYVVADGSAKANILKTIFPLNVEGKNSVLLRVCHNCYEVVGKLEEFSQICNIADAKRKSQMELEREFAKRKNTLDEFEKKHRIRNHDISMLLKDYRNKTKIVQPTSKSVDRNGTDLPRHFTADMIEKTYLSVSHWMKETLAQKMLDHGLCLKNETDQNKIHQLWSGIQEKLKLLGIRMEISEMIIVWKELVEITKQKTEKGLPQDHLGTLVQQYLNGNAILPGQLRIAIDKLKEKSPFKKFKASKSTLEDKLDSSSSNHGYESSESSRASRMSPINNSEKGPPRLSPQKTIVAEIKSPTKESVWNIEREKKFVHLIGEELLPMAQALSENEKLSYTSIIERIREKHEEFQQFTLGVLRCRLTEAKKKFCTPEYRNTDESRILQRLSVFVNGSSGVGRPASKLKNYQRFRKRKIVGRHRKNLNTTDSKKPRTEFTYDDKLKLLEEVTKEFELLKSLNIRYKSAWPKILVRLNKRNTFNFTKQQLSYLWGHMRMSAKTHSKEGQDPIDFRVWKLLQDHDNFKNMLKIKVESDVNTSDTNNKNQITERQRNNNVEQQGIHYVNNADNKIIDDNDDHCILEDNNVDPSSEDDRFDEISEKSQLVESKTSTQEKGKLCFDKFKFVKAMRRELKIMCDNKEACLGKPFQRIHTKLAEKEYSDFALKDLQNKWRNMKCLAVQHQKNGILSDLDKAVLDLVNYKKQREHYENPDSPAEAASSKGGSSSGSEGSDADDDASNDSVDVKMNSSQTRNSVPFFKAMLREIVILSKENTKCSNPFIEVYRRLVRKGYADRPTRISSRWSAMKIRTLKRRDDGIPPRSCDHLIFKIIDVANEIQNKSTSVVTNNIVKENNNIDEKQFIIDVGKAYTKSLTSRKNPHRKVPVLCVLDQLRKDKEYSKYGRGFLRDVWRKISTSVILKNKNGDRLNEIDRLYLSTVKKLYFPARNLKKNCIRKKIPSSRICPSPSATGSESAFSLDDNTKNCSRKYNSVPFFETMLEEFNILSEENTKFQFPFKEVFHRMIRKGLAEGTIIQLNGRWWAMHRRAMERRKTGKPPRPCDHLIFKIIDVFNKIQYNPGSVNNMIGTEKRDFDEKQFITDVGKVYAESLTDRKNSKAKFPLMGVVNQLRKHKEYSKYERSFLIDTWRKISTEAKLRKLGGRKLNEIHRLSFSTVKKLYCPTGNLNENAVRQESFSSNAAAGNDDSDDDDRNGVKKYKSVQFFEAMLKEFVILSKENRIFKNPFEEVYSRLIRNGFVKGTRNQISSRWLSMKYRVNKRRESGMPPMKCDHLVEKIIKVSNRIQQNSKSVANNIIKGKINIDEKQLIIDVGKAHSNILRRETNPRTRYPFTMVLAELRKNEEYSKFERTLLRDVWRRIATNAKSTKKNGSQLNSIQQLYFSTVNKLYSPSCNLNGNAIRQELSSSSDEAQGNDDVISREDDVKNGSKVNSVKFFEVLLQEFVSLSQENRKLKKPFKEVYSRLIRKRLAEGTISLLNSRWLSMKNRALKRRENGKPPGASDHLIFKIIDIANRIRNNSRSITNEIVKKKIDEKQFITDVGKAYTKALAGRTNAQTKFPLLGVLCELKKNRKYSKLKRPFLINIWRKISTEAKSKKRDGDKLDEVHRLYFSTVKKLYCPAANRNKRAPISSSSSSDSDSEDKDLSKNGYPEDPGPSTSTPKPSRKPKWSEFEKMNLFKLIKQEYVEMEKRKVTIPSTPWPELIKIIAEKKSFKTSDVTELERLWRKMRHDFSVRENTTNMTDIDWKMSRLITRHKRNMGMIVKDRQPEVLKERPRRRFIEDSDSDNNSRKHSKDSSDVEFVPSTEDEDFSDQFKQDLIKIMEREGEKAFTKTDLNQTSSLWMTVDEELKKLGHEFLLIKVRNCWKHMIARAKRSMASQTQPNEIDRQVIKLIRSRNVPTAEESEKEEIKDEQLSENELQIDADKDELQNDADKDDLMNYEHVSFKDIGLEDKDSISITEETLEIKTDLDKSTKESFHSFEAELENILDRNRNEAINQKPEEPIGNSFSNFVVDDDMGLDALLADVQYIKN